MDTQSISRRSLLGNSTKLGLGAVAAIAVGSVASRSASAEHSAFDVVERVLVPHGNGAYTLGEISAFHIDTATGRTIDWNSAVLHDTGMLVSLKLPAELNR